QFFPQNNQWSLGLTLSIPLFNGLRDYATYHSNAAKLQTSQFQQQNIRLTLKRDLKRTYYDYIEALHQEIISNGFNKAAQIRADISRNKYKNGLLSFEEWDRIENELILKQKEILSSEKNRIIKQALWEKALATGVFK
ncbi:MAG: TolC family protein, partial [Bdellovibrionales bacterium]